MTDLVDAERDNPCTTEPGLDVTDEDPSVTARVDDVELTAQALAATGTDTVDPDAVNYWDVVGPVRTGLLPDWYMPTPSAGARRLRGWRRRVVFLVVFSIGVINAAGLCVTYGYVTFG